MMNITYHIWLLLLWYFPLSEGSFDDDEFVFVLGFPKLEFKEYQLDLVRIFVEISTEVEREVNVTISALASDSSFTHEGTVSQSKAWTQEMDRSFHIVEERSNKAIIVQANGRVYVYGLSTARYSADTFQILPVQTLGSLYFAVTWHSTSNDERSEILIIGLSDNTKVNITLPASQLPSRYNISKFETLQIQVEDDLTGTRVEADKPIAVYSGNEKAKIYEDSSNSDKYDHLIEMLPSVDKLGKHFVIASTPMRNRSDFIKMVGISPNTQISITGSKEMLILLETSGSSSLLKLETSSILEITSTFNILVAQFTQNTELSSAQKSDASMVIVPPVEQWDKSYSFGVHDTIPFTHYIIVMINDSWKAGLLLDGTNISARLHRIGQTEYATGFVSVSPGPHTLRHTEENVTFGALLYGGEKSMAYYHSLVQYLHPLNQADEQLSKIVTSQQIPAEDIIRTNYPTMVYQTTTNAETSKNNEVTSPRSSTEGTITTQAEQSSTGPMATCSKNPYEGRFYQILYNRKPSIQPMLTRNVTFSKECAMLCLRTTLCLTYSVANISSAMVCILFQNFDLGDATSYEVATLTYTLLC